MASFPLQPEPETPSGSSTGASPEGGPAALREAASASEGAPPNTMSQVVVENAFGSVGSQGDADLHAPTVPGVDVAVTDAVPTATADLSTAGAGGSPPLLGKLTALFLKAGRRGFWPLADQGIASVGNFLTIIFVARGLSENENGTFTLIMESVLFLLSLHGSVVTYPLTVRGAVVDDYALRRLATASLLITLLLAVPTACVALAVGKYYHLVGVLLVAVAGLVVWQMQEAMRRGMMSHFRHQQAIVGDCISYLGQAAVLYVLWKMGSLTITSTFLTLGVTSLLSLLIQAWQVGIVRVGFWETVDVIIDFFHTGRWAALTTLSNLSLMACGSWALAKFHGTGQVGNFAAIGGLLKVCNPVIQGIGGLIVPASAKALARGGMPEARRIALKMSAMAGLILAPIFLVLLLFPRPCLQLAFKSKYNGADHVHALQLFVLGYFLVYLTTMLTSFFNGVHRTRFTFYGQITASAAMFAIMLPMNIAFGWMGYVVGGIFQGVIQLAVLIWLLRKVIAPQGPQRGFEVVQPQPA